MGTDSSVFVQAANQGVIKTRQLYEQRTNACFLIRTTDSARTPFASSNGTPCKTASVASLLIALECY